MTPLYFGPGCRSAESLLDLRGQLGQGRLEGVRFAVLVFTNLAHEHLDFHGSMEAYFQAKRRLGQK